MSHPESDPGRKDDTEKMNNMTFKRGPKRPKKSERPLSKTIGFGMQAPVAPQQGGGQQGAPEVDEAALWKALDGAVNEAKGDEETAKVKLEPKRPTKPQASAHRTRLGMPALSPDAALPLTKKETETGSGDDAPLSSIPNEALMKTLAQFKNESTAAGPEDGDVEVLGPDDPLVDLVQETDKSAIGFVNDTEEERSISASFPTAERPSRSTARAAAGKAAEETVETPSERDEASSPVGSAKTELMTAPGTDEARPLRASASRGRGRWLIGAMAIVLLGGIAFGAFYLLTRPQSADLEQTAQSAKKAPPGKPDIIAASAAPMPVLAPNPPEAEAAAETNTAPVSNRAPAAVAPETPPAFEIVSPSPAVGRTAKTPTPSENRDETERMKTDAPSEEKISAKKAAEPAERLETRPPSEAGGDDHVTITLYGVLDGATVTVDGQPMEKTFSVPRSDSCIKVVVSLFGYRSAVKRVLPARDKDIKVKLVKEEAP